MMRGHRLSVTAVALASDEQHVYSGGKVCLGVVWCCMVGGLCGVLPAFASGFCFCVGVMRWVWCVWRVTMDMWVTSRVCTGVRVSAHLVSVDTCVGRQA